MNEEEEVSMVEQPCPSCGYVMKFPPAEAGEKAPTEWDVALCLNCAEPSVFHNNEDGKMGLRKMTEQDTIMLLMTEGGQDKLMALLQYKVAIRSWRKTHEPSTQEMIMSPQGRNWSIDEDE